MRNRSPKNDARRACDAVAASAIGARRLRRPRRGGAACRASASRSPTRRAPSPRRAPRSTGGARASRDSASAAARARSVLPTPAGPSTSSGRPSSRRQADSDERGVVVRRGSRAFSSERLKRAVAALRWCPKHSWCDAPCILTAKHVGSRRSAARRRDRNGPSRRARGEPGAAVSRRRVATHPEPPGVVMMRRPDQHGVGAPSLRSPARSARPARSATSSRSSPSRAGRASSSSSRSARSARSTSTRGNVHRRAHERPRGAPRRDALSLRRRHARAARHDRSRASSTSGKRFGETAIELDFVSRRRALPDDGAPGRRGLLRGAPRRGRACSTSSIATTRSSDRPPPQLERRRTAHGRRSSHGRDEASSARRIPNENYIPVPRETAKKAAGRSRRDLRRVRRQAIASPRSVGASGSSSSRSRAPSSSSCRGGFVDGAGAASARAARRSSRRSIPALVEIHAEVRRRSERAPSSATGSRASRPAAASTIRSSGRRTARRTARSEARPRRERTSRRSPARIRTRGSSS